MSDTEGAARPAVITEVEGSPYLCGLLHFVLEPERPTQHRPSAPVRLANPDAALAGR